MALAGQLEIQILADLAKLKTQMDQANSIVGQGAKGMERALAGVKAALGGIAAGLTVAAFASWIRGAIDSADAASKLSQKIGVATEDVAGLKLAYQLGGAGADAMTTSIGKLARSIGENNVAFQMMGVRTKDAQGQLRGTKEVLYDVADKFAAMPDGVRKTSLAMEIFGKSGAELIPLLNSGSAGFKEMDDMARKLGLTIDTETGKKAEQFNDTLDLIHKSSQGLATRVMAQLLPTLQSMAGSFLDSSANGDRLSRTAEIIVNFLKILYSVGVGVVEVFSTLGKTLGGAAGVIVAVLHGDFSLAKSIAAETFTDIKSGWGDAARQIAKAWDDQGNASVANAAKINKALGGTIDDYKKAADEAKKAAALIAELGGLSGSFAEDWSRLTGLYTKGLLTQQQLIEAQAKLLANQPGIKKAKEDELKVVKDLVDAWEKYRQEIDQDFSKAAEASSKIGMSLYEQEKALESSSEEMRLQASLIGTTNTQRQLAIEKLRIQRDLEEQILKINAEALPNMRAYYIEKAQRIAAERTAQAEQAAALSEQIERINSIESAAHDVWTNVLEGGTNVWKKLKDTAKTIFFDWLYQMTLKKWIINIAASITGGGGASGLAQAAAGTGGFNPLNLLNGGGSSGIANIANSIGLTNFAAGASGVGGSFASTVGAGLATDAMGATVAEGAAAATLGSSGAAVGGMLSTIGAAMPYIGLAFAAAQALGLFKHGGPKTESSFGSEANGRGDASGATTIAQGIQAQYAALAALYGLSPELSNLGVSYAMDPQGTAQTQLEVRGGSYSRIATTGGYENVARGEDGLKEAAALASAQLILKNLQDSPEMTGAIGDYLRAINITGASLDTLTQALQAVGDVGVFDKTVRALGPTFSDLTSLSIDAKDAMVQAVGGAQAFSGQFNSFLNDFSTEAEKNDAIWRGLVDAFTQANVVLPSTRDAFKEAVNTALAAGDANALKTLLGAESAFNQLYPAIDATAGAATSAADAMQQWQQSYFASWSAINKAASTSAANTAAFAGSVLTNVSDKFKSLISGISDEINRINGDFARNSATGSLAASQAAFDQLAAIAYGGGRGAMEAAKLIPEAAEALRAMAKEQSATVQQWQSIELSTAGALTRVNVSLQAQQRYRMKDLGAALMGGAGNATSFDDYFARYLSRHPTGPLDSGSAHVAKEVRRVADGIDRVHATLDKHGAQLERHGTHLAQLDDFANGRKGAMKVKALS